MSAVQQITRQVALWFNGIDGGRNEMRVRLPVVLLPAALVLVAVALVRVSVLQHQLGKQLGVTENTATSLVAIANRNSAGAGLPPGSADETFRVGLVALADLSTTLNSWLKQGRNTGEQAQLASALAELVAQQRSRQQVLPGVGFWQRFSGLLASLEQAVREGSITTPEAKSLVVSLRDEYARLRSIDITDAAAVPSTAPSSVAAPAPAPQGSAALSALNTQLSNTSVLHRKLGFWQTLAALLVLFSLALLCLLLYGLWRVRPRRVPAREATLENQQQAILQLLDEITPLADGDLRVSATVSEAATGAIADAFNFAVAELRRLVGAITNSAELVKKSVSETRESADQLARASAVQAREIHRSSNYLNVMSDTMAQLSAHAVESSRIADTSVKQAQIGALAVNASVEGLLRIRDQAEMTTRLMQRLLDSSQAINERVADITAVAKRTDLLALNTTIKAASAVHHGSPDDLSRLADDVSYLAETLGGTTRDIVSLTDIIHQDATLSLESMRKTILELDAGQSRARQAKVSLEAIENVSHELHGLISDIASKSLRQAGVVKQLSANMGVINDITRESSSGLQGSARALEELQGMTAALRDSVADFKLPGEPRTSSTPAGRALASVHATDARSGRGVTDA